MNEIILTSSVLILLLAVLRRLLRGKISPALQYALWLLVAARLLIPGTLFTAPVTIVGLAEDVRIAVEESIAEETPPAAENTSPTYIPGQTITVTPLPLPENNTNTAVLPSPPTPSVPAKPNIDWRDTIWKAGIFTVSAVFLTGNLLFYRQLRRKRQRIPENELPIRCPVPVYYVEELSAPCLFGLKSAIYVNDAAMDPHRLHHVLQHELTHRRHGDHFWALLRCVCLAIHWYNPLVWWAAMLSRRDCEICCDSAVISSLGVSSGISYGETLMAMLTTSPTTLLHTATTMSAGKRNMAERLKLIVHRPRMMKLTLAAVALVTIGAVILTFGGCAGETNTGDDTSVTENGGQIDDTDNKQPADNDQTTEDGKLIPPENGFGYIPSPTYSHPSGLFTMKIPHDCPVVTVETEDGVSFFDVDQYQSGSEDGWILSVYPQPADWVGNQNPTLTLDTFDTNGTPQIYVIEYSEAYSEQFVNLRDWITASFTLQATVEQFSRLIHDNYEDNLTLAISYLPYLSWRSYRELYGFYELELLQSALYQFADSGQATWDQYHDILSLTNDGLDGAYTEGLSGIFAALYLQNSERFLSVVNSEYITDTERARVARYVKYELNSHSTEGDSEEVTFNDYEIIQGLSRGYSPTVWSTGSPEGLTITLTGDWTLEGIRSALFSAVAGHVSGTLLEGDLRSIDIAYSFRFPEEMRDGVTFTVPFHATYVDQDVHTLPSGATHSPSSRTGELTATILLAGTGVTGPVDDAFARGQALYDLLAQFVTIGDGLNVSVKDESFQLLEYVRAMVDQRLADAGLSECCKVTSMSAGEHYNPFWCDIGYEQSIEYSVTIMYIENELSYTFTFPRTVIVTTTE